MMRDVMRARARARARRIRIRVRWFAARVGDALSRAYR